MRSYLALIAIDLKLALRDKSVIFFNYLFPFVFFFAFTEIGGTVTGAAMAQVVTMVLAIGALGNGLWGAGMRLVQEREANILRRFKVTPISPAPLLIASMLTGWLLFLPVVALTLGLAHFLYRMPIPEQWPSLAIFISVGVLAFRGLGLIIASVVNSAQESTIAIQLLYMPMLFLSGATFPVTLLPSWAQIVGQFLPATYLITGLQGIILKNENLVRNAVPALALMATIALATFISIQIFRWEKGERLGGRARLWVLAVLTPFLVMGVWQAYSKEQSEKSEILWRDLQRADTFLIRGARLFVGDGQVIESGTVLVKEGKIAEIYPGNGPEPKSLQAELVEAFGKTLLPGLIDVHVHLGSPGGLYADPKEYGAADAMDRALAAYLYSGVTAVRSVGDWANQVFAARDRGNHGRRLGAELHACGPMFTAEGGHGTEYVEYFPESMRASALAQLARTPKTPEEGRRMVAELKQAGADCIKGILEAGRAGHLFERMDPAILRAVAEEAAAKNLPVAVHTGSPQDLVDAIGMPITTIEHGTLTDEIPDAVLAAMAKKGIAYDPTLSVYRAMTTPAAQRAGLLDRSLVQQVGPAKLLEDTKKKIGDIKLLPAEAAERVWQRATANLLKAHRAGVTLVTGSDAGNLLVVHGPTVHQELQLWVKAGIPPAVALLAATSNAARVLRADHRIGRIAKGFEASLLLVDGNPLEDIAATERISLVVFKGERVRRAKLFNQK